MRVIWGVNLESPGVSGTRHSQQIGHRVVSCMMAGFHVLPLRLMTQSLFPPSSLMTGALWVPQVPKFSMNGDKTSGIQHARQGL